MSEIKRIGVISLAKMVGLIYGIIGIVILLFMGCLLLTGTQASPTDSLEGLSSFPFFCFLPLIYAIIGIVAGAVFGLLYNAIARRFGGIELELMPASISVNVADKEQLL